MVRLLIDGEDRGDAIEQHARVLLHEQNGKDKAPRGVLASRALVPDWCDVCGERCWGRNGGMFSACPKCRGEGKTPIGFNA